MNCLQQKNRLFVILCLPVFLLGLSCLGLTGCVGESSSTIVENPEKQGQVVVAFDFGGRKPNREFKADCYEGSTLFSILESAKKMGEIVFESTGAGETAFIKSFEGVENEGANGDNWVYRVNGELGKTSYGLYLVQPDDQIEWRIGIYPLKVEE